MGKLGEILKERGLVDEPQLHSALRLQAARGGRLGEALAGLGFLAARDLARALAAQFRLPFVDLRRAGLAGDLARLFPGWLARRYRAFPLGPTPDGFAVALGDPRDLGALDALAFRLGAPVSPALADPADLRAALDRCYPLSA